MVAYSSKQQSSEEESRGFGLVALALVLSFFVVASVQAQPYVGFGAGIGTSKDTTPLGRPAFNDWKKPTSATLNLFAGYRFGYFGGEAGFIQLPKYEAYAEGTNPTRQTHQTIKAQSFYGRVNAYLPLGEVTPYGFWGIARTAAQSSESGTMGSYDCEVKGYSSIYGVGLRYKNLRAEVTHIPEAFQSHWTGSRAYTLATASYVVSF
jgi:hypothetical protein